MEKWNKIKNKYIIGQKIITKINCIYPQGIIFNVGEMFHGIADYDECKAKYGSKYLYSGNEMEMDIIGYDDDNMWIKLKPNNI
jgi:ribosomal protein S1